MAFSDIFNIPFFISLGITLLLAGLLGMFFVQRLQEQNHKMSSMLGLVSTMADELNVIRNTLNILSYNNIQQGGKTKHVDMSTANTSSNKLISVSDDESNDDVDSDSDSDDNDSDDSDSDDEDIDEAEYVDSEPESDNKIIIELNPVKIIKFDNLSKENDEIIVEELDIESDDDIEEDNIEDIVIDQEPQELDQELQEQVQDIIIDEFKEGLPKDMNFIKNIDIFNLEETEIKEVVNIDYKKMSLDKLKNIATTKGLINNDNSLKITKNAIIKMLEA